MPDRKFGRISPEVLPHHDPNVLQFSAVRKPKLKTPPAKVNWYKPNMPGMMGLNDELGTCGPLSCAVMMEIWTGLVRPSPVVIPDSAILAAYETQGYDPSQTNPRTGRNPTDQGVVLSKLFDTWATDGIGGMRIIAPIAVDPNDLDHVEWAFEVYMGGIIGWNLPQSAIDQTDVHQPWTYVRGSTNAGGHATPCYGYGNWGKNSGPGIRTWANDQPVGWDFFRAYAEEVWVFRTDLYLDSESGLAPNGLNAVSLDVDAGLI